MIPGPLRGVVREVFQKRLTHSVMLDWGGSIVKRFGYEPGVANIYVNRPPRMPSQTSHRSCERRHRGEIFQRIDRA